MSLFFRLHSDRTQSAAALEDTFAGTTKSACWLIGGGPSLSRLPYAAIRNSPLPKMCINLAGTRLLRPTFWTSYDPSVRFHRSVYLDPGIMKFVHRRRAMDVVPETTFKVCDCPNTYFFERDGQRGFADFVSARHERIVDWADSMVQAIDILYRLGFRVLYLAGCEMRVRPSREQLAHAAAKGVLYRPHELLQDFVERCAAAGITAEALDTVAPCPIYHFAETKPLKSAANTDHHYFRIAQYLRLSRRAMAMGGLQLISVTPHSRLNDYFPYVPVRKVLQRIAREVGDPANEPVQGQYQQTSPRTETRRGPMRDYRPHHWPPAENVARPRTKRDSGKVEPSPREFLIEAEGAGRRVESDMRDVDRRERLREKLSRQSDEAFEIDECG